MNTTLKYDAKNVACNFYDWLIEMQYCDIEDKQEDIEDIINDFRTIQKDAPKLFNLLRCISN